MNKFKMSFGIGIPSIIVIFITLSITTLASLSLTSANYNYKLAKKNAEYVSSYYMAENVAANEIAKINAAISNGSYDKPAYSFKIPINNNQTLCLEYIVKDNKYIKANHYIEITEIWDYDDYNIQYGDIKIDN